MRSPEPELIAVEAIGPHSLWLRFADGVEGVVDVGADLWGPVFEPLKDPEFFAQVKLGGDGSPSWPNGADMAPDALYEDITAAVRASGPA